MIDKSIFFIWFIWYIYAYGPKPSFILFKILRFFYISHQFFISYNKSVYPGYWDDDITEPNEIELIPELESVSIKSQPKYEDKYLNEIRKMNKEWEFTDEEKSEIPKLFEDFLNGHIESRLNRIEEITNEINRLKKEMAEDTDIINCIETSDSEEEELIQQTTLEIRNEQRNKQILFLQEESDNLKKEIDTDEGLQKLKQSSQMEAEKYIIHKKLDKLINSYVIEKTPIGNVLMIYKKNTESFHYYSDCNIPYRYLEVVGRKYIKMFNCRPIFVDMEEELKLFEEKWEREQEIKKIKEEKQKNDELIKNKSHVQEKKSVFAKFKSYNKEAGGKITMAAPPKNSIPNKSINEVKDDQKILLKEKANRYTYEGKFANFNFLQKIERKVFNKKLELSFADFKKMNKK